MVSIKKVFAGLIIFFSLAPNSSFAAKINYTATFLSGDYWRYDYEIKNDDLESLQEFTIYFDEKIYGNVLKASGPGGWDLLIVQPDINLPAAGFLDGLATSGGISKFSSVSGFSVTFQMLDGGTPGAQFFSIVDPKTFTEIGTGLTAKVAEVPSPSPVLLMLSGGVIMLGVRRHVSERVNTNVERRGA